MSFSAYLVGTWEKRFRVNTVLHIINPTLESLDVIVAFLDDDEEFVKCITTKKPLSANKLWEIVVPKLGPHFGVVKIVSFKDKKVKPGIVGFQRHLLAIPEPTEVAFSEAPLLAVPMEYAQKEYDRIRKHCSEIG